MRGNLNICIFLAVKNTFDVTLWMERWMVYSLSWHMCMILWWSVEAWNGAEAWAHTVTRLQLNWRTDSWKQQVAGRQQVIVSERNKEALLEMETELGRACYNSRCGKKLQEWYSFRPYFNIPHKVYSEQFSALFLLRYERWVSFSYFFLVYLVLFDLFFFAVVVGWESHFFCFCMCKIKTNFIFSKMG